METIYYIVESLDGDYAHLRREDMPEAEDRLVARALLPEETDAGVRLKYELFSYEIADEMSRS